MKKRYGSYNKGVREYVKSSVSFPYYVPVELDG